MVEALGHELGAVVRANGLKHPALEHHAGQHVDHPAAPMFRAPWIARHFWLYSPTSVSKRTLRPWASRARSQSRSSRRGFARGARSRWQEPSLSIASRTVESATTGFKSRSRPPAPWGASPEQASGPSTPCACGYKSVRQFSTPYRPPAGPYHWSATLRFAGVNGRSTRPRTASSRSHVRCPFRSSLTTVLSKKLDPKGRAAYARRRPGCGTPPDSDQNTPLRVGTADPDVVTDDAFSENQTCRFHFVPSARSTNAARSTRRKHSTRTFCPGRQVTPR